MRHLLAQVLERKPDVVLVDTRTGLTDLGFLAALQLPALCVLVYRLNPDGVDGIRMAHDLFKGREPPLDFLYVASMVPLTEYRAASEAKRQALARGVCVDVEIPMEPPLFLADELYARSRVDHHLVERYAQR